MSTRRKIERLEHRIANPLPQSIRSQLAQSVFAKLFGLGGDDFAAHIRTAADIERAKLEAQRRRPRRREDADTDDAIELVEISPGVWGRPEPRRMRRR